MKTNKHYWIDAFGIITLMSVSVFALKFNIFVALWLFLYAVVILDLYEKIFNCRHMIKGKKEVSK